MVWTRFNGLAGAATSLALSLLGGCDRTPVAVEILQKPSLAANAKVDTTTQARFTWADSVDVGTGLAPSWVPSAIRGDNRLRDGAMSGLAGPSNEYQGHFCGVDAVIGGQLYIDPDRYWSGSLPATCQPARYYRYYVNGPSQPPSIVRPSNRVPNIDGMAVGDTLIEPFDSGTMSELGFGLWWDDAHPPSSSVRVTRLPNVTDESGRSVRQWRVETRGSHKAVMVVPTSGKKPGSTVTSTFYVLPWVMTITEVPYPFLSFP